AAVTKVQPDLLRGIPLPLRKRNDTELLRQFPAELAKELSVVSFPQWQWDASQEIRLRVLRWRKASRCTLEIALSTSSGPQELIGKVYAEDRSDVYRTMEQIRKAGFDSEDEFAIPRPVAFLASMRLLLYEKVSG